MFPPVFHVPVLLYRFWEYNRCDPRERNGEENGELVEEQDVLVLCVFREYKRPERRHWIHDQCEFSEEADQEKDISPLRRGVRCGGK